MKKRILSVLLALCMVLCLAPTAVFADGENTQNEKIYRYCFSCKKYRTQEIIGYTANAGWGTSDMVHFIIVKCLTCNEENTFADGEDKYKFHTGGTETPTCTTGKTCEKCGAEYGNLGHDWGEWQSNGDNKTHTRTCKREGCNAVDTASCGGDGTATCVTLGTCADCGQQYYSGHTFPSGFKWTSDTDIGRDAEKHWVRCLNCEEGKAHEGTHYFVPFNIYLKSEPTCISNAVYYKSCWTCDYKGTDTYVDQWGQLDPDNHDGGTEVKNAKAATCTEKGYTGDTHCKGCGVKLSDGTDISALDHDWGNWSANDDGTHTRVCKRDATHKETKPCSGGTATCSEQAVCEVCGVKYGSVNAKNHPNLMHVEAKAATKWSEGNIEYWHCSDCSKYYKDAAAAQEITEEQTVTSRLSFGGDPIDNPKTGAGNAAESSMTLWTTVLLACAAVGTVAAVCIKKKKQSEN